jgi:hypothetical protein
VLTKLQSQVDDERHPKTNITVGQSIDKWLEVVDLAESTRGRYEDLIRIYIRPGTKTVDLTAIPPESQPASARLSGEQHPRSSATNSQQMIATGLGRNGAATI